MKGEKVSFIASIRRGEIVAVESAKGATRRGLNGISDIRQSGDWHPPRSRRKIGTGCSRRHTPNCYFLFFRNTTTNGDVSKLTQGVYMLKMYKNDKDDGHVVFVKD